MKLLRRAVALDPSHLEARYALSRALMRLGLTDDARRELQVFEQLQQKAMQDERRRFQENQIKIDETLKAGDQAGAGTVRCLIAVLTGCSQADCAHGRSRSRTSPQAAGVTFTHINGASADKYLVETMGSGGLLFDYDNDGWVDLFLVDGGSIADSTVNARARHRLFRNVGKGAFRDVTESSGIRHREYGMGACAGDVDNDGRTDLYITNYGPNVLYRNAGNGVFTDVTRTRRCRARGVEHELCVPRRGCRRRSRFVRDELPRCAEDQQPLLR